uniref:Uncharacterized protein n=1 Tax=Arundo donax TaxID=35708 RepID=A0A0A9HLY9_ARUDO
MGRIELYLSSSWSLKNNSVKLVFQWVGRFYCYLFWRSESTTVPGLSRISHCSNGFVTQQLVRSYSKFSWATSVTSVCGSLQQ